MFIFSCISSWASQAALVVKNLPANAGDVRDVGLIPEKISWWRKWQPTQVFLPGESYGQRSLVGYRSLVDYSPWGPGGLQSMGSQRVRHDWATKLSIHSVESWLQHTGSFIAANRLLSLVEVYGLSRPVTCEISVSWPGIEPASPGLEDEVLTTGPPGKSPQDCSSKVYST